MIIALRDNKQVFVALKTRVIGRAFDIGIRETEYLSRTMLVVPVFHYLRVIIIENKNH